jgi:PPOX class probable F420-dependent enzyme
MPGYIPMRKADAWLRATRSIWLTSAGPDGTPHAAPVWFTWDGRSIYFCTGHATVKHRNLRHRPSVTAHLGDGDDVLIARGRVAIVSARNELGSVDEAFRQKYVDPHSGATAGYPQSPTDVPYRIDIERLVVWEYGVVATRTDFVIDGGEWIALAPARAGGVDR